MASDEKAIILKKNTDIIEIQEPKVSKLTNKFEALAEKASRGLSDMDISPESEAHAHTKAKDQSHVENKQAQPQPQPQGHADDAQGELERRKEAHHSKTVKQDTAGIEGENKNSPSLEEIGKLRAQAQQNSMEAIRSAEERYAKATEAGSASLHDVKECVVHGIGAVSSYVADKSVAAKDTTLEKAQKGLGATKEAVATAGGGALHYAGEKAYEAKEASIGIGKTVVDYTKESAEKAKELAVKKGAEAKDVVVSSGESAVSYVGEKAVEAKDTALNVGKTAVTYAGEKAVAAKDVTLETGKNALGFAGQKASEAKGGAVDTSKSTIKQASSKSSEAKTDVDQKKDEDREEKQQVVIKEGDEKENIEGWAMEAVGETFVEIAKTAKELVVGQEEKEEEVVAAEKKEQ